MHIGTLTACIWSFHLPSITYRIQWQKLAFFPDNIWNLNKIEVNYYLWTASTFLIFQQGVYVMCCIPMPTNQLLLFEQEAVIGGPWHSHTSPSSLWQLVQHCQLKQVKSTHQCLMSKMFSLYDHGVWWPFAMVCTCYHVKSYLKEMFSFKDTAPLMLIHRIIIKKCIKLFHTSHFLAVVRLTCEEDL